MEIKFVPVTDKNIEIVSLLHISNEQAGMVETVKECYTEAKELSLWRPAAIWIDYDLIGFAMYGLWKNEGKSGRVWLDRFFIDEHFQGKGYSKMVLPALLSHIEDEYDRNEIFLSVYENNSVAIRLYEKFGFLQNGELDINGEKVMVRTNFK